MNAVVLVDGYEKSGFMERRLHLRLLAAGRLFGRFSPVGETWIRLPQRWTLDTSPFCCVRFGSTFVLTMTEPARRNPLREVLPNASILVGWQTVNPFVSDRD